MKTKITVITGNVGKLQEYASLLPECELVAAKQELVEIQSLDIEEVATHKAAEAYAALGVPVLVDDSCIVIHRWNGLPGALTSWFLKAVGNAGILRMAADLNDRSATVKTALGYCDENGVKVFVGELGGEITTEERGKNGFGFDPIFVPSGHEKTLAEMDGEEKNALSMRKLAVEKLRDFLAS